MQKKQYIEDQRSISPVLESGSYKHNDGYMKGDEKNTLAMFNQLFIDSNKLAADDENDNTDGEAGESSNGEENEEEIIHLGDGNHHDDTAMVDGEKKIVDGEEYFNIYETET